MGSRQISGLAASFDLESYGLDPVYGRLLCGVVKPWDGEAKVFRVKRASSNDKKLVQELVAELSQYAIIFAHNGLFHDRAFLNGRALYHGLEVLDTNGKLVDPYLVAKKKLNMPRNSLDALADFFQLEEGKMHLSPTVWVRAALDHDQEAMDQLVERCKSDVRVLEMLAKRLFPLIGNINPWGSA